jgi:formamidopyrimidine-DNA glycosylase
LHLDNGTSVYFHDPRKFGKMWLDKDTKAVSSQLGPEPLDENFTMSVLGSILEKRKAPVKAVLLDQAIIAGIGNMYADESLFEARIHPMKPANSLSKVELKRLYLAIQLVLRKALEKKGASVRNYIRPDGAPGTAHDEFNVAHGVGKNCPRCGMSIERIVVRGRGTYVCPRCQPKP